MEEKGLKVNVDKTKGIKQGSTNLIFASTDFCVQKMALHAYSYMQNYMCIKQ